MNFKYTKKKAASFLLSALLAVSVFAGVQQPAEARIVLTPLQEQQVGWGKINQAGAVYQQDNQILGKIQDDLIRANKGRLVAYKDDNHRGIRTPHLLITNRTLSNAFSVPGGHIFITDAMIASFLSVRFNPDTGGCLGMQKEREFGNFYELYGHSAIAMALAHEDVHWERFFLQRETDAITSLCSTEQENDLKLKIKVADGAGFNRKLDELGFSDEMFPKIKKFVCQEEYEADKAGLTLLDNTETYSPGSLITVVSRLREDAFDPNPKTLVHPSKEARIQLAIDHIRELSHGRVEVGQDGKMKLDGKLFMGIGFLPGRQDVMGIDRTVYVAGQLAKSVKFGANRLEVLDDSYSHSQAKGMYPIVAVNDKTHKRILIDKLDISQYDASVLTTDKECGHSAEMKAAKELRKFIEKTENRN